MVTFNSFKELREATGLSQKEFADKTQIPVSTVRHWDQGTSNPAPYMLGLLTHAVRDMKLLSKSSRQVPVDDDDEEATSVDVEDYEGSPVVGPAFDDSGEDEGDDESTDEYDVE